MLDDMIAHFKQTSNNSCLVRIYGIFTIDTSVFDPVDIILMENTLKSRKS